MAFLDRGHLAWVQQSGPMSEIRETEAVVEDLWAIRYMLRCCEDCTALLNHLNTESRGPKVLSGIPCLRNCYPQGFFSGKEVFQ